MCAVSGGPDSLALLVLAVEAGCQVTAVHVDHVLRPGSADEADVVADAARRYGAAFRAVRTPVAPGPNVEARARAARRQAVGPGAATGHTMDDQAETVLINLLRGAATDGLAAMRAGHAHPLLGIRRTDTERVCAAEGLVPVRDPSNQDLTLVRNRVRHQVLPLCEAVAGRDLVPVLARQAAVLADDAALLDALAAVLDPTDGPALAAAPRPLARRAVRTWLRAGGAYPPDLASVDRVLAVARGEVRAAEVAGGRRVARRRGRLAVDPLPVPPSEADPVLVPPSEADPVLVPPSEADPALVSPSEADPALVPPARGHPVSRPPVSLSPPSAVGEPSVG